MTSPTIDDIRVVTAQPLHLGSQRLDSYDRTSVIDHLRTIALRLVPNTSAVTDAYIVADRLDATAVLRTRHNDFTGIIEIPTDSTLLTNSDDTTLLAHIDLIERTVTVWHTDAVSYADTLAALLEHLA